MKSPESKSILLVDDDETIRFTLTELLASEGYTVISAENGLQALEQLKAGLPSLILLDMKMPIMNGWKFATEFVARYDRKVPIIVMTAAPDAETRAREISAIAWVGKPFRIDELIEKIEQFAK